MALYGSYFKKLELTLKTNQKFVNAKKSFLKNRWFRPEQGYKPLTTTEVLFRVHKEELFAADVMGQLNKKPAREQLDAT